MSKQTLYKYFKDLEELGMVKYTTQLSLQIAEQEKIKMQKPVPVELKKVV